MPRRVAARRLLELREQQFAAAPNDSQVARDLTFALHRLAGVLGAKGVSLRTGWACANDNWRWREARPRRSR